MKTRYISLLIIASIALASCARHMEEDINPMDKDIVFKAGWEDSSNSTTKTVLQEDGTSVWWSNEEKINVFFGNTRSGVYTSSNTSPAAEASFTGTLALKDGVTEESSSASYWAVYPYNENNTCDGESVTLTIPANQTATEGTFADNFFPAVARSKNSKLSFYNVCGGVRFSVYNEGITSVSIKSNAGESLVGTVKIVFDDNGKPSVSTVTAGGDVITVTAPEGGFVPGKYYFAALLPQTLSYGLKLTFVKSDSKQASHPIEKAITVNRSRFGKLDNKDRDLSFETVGSIEFADANIKAKLVAAFDTNGDGEISFEEAGAVKSGDELRKAFGNEKSFKSFDEFQFFTGIESLVNDQFFGWKELESILLPTNIISIGDEAFAGCASLASLKLPDGVRSIGEYAFSGCKGLESIRVPESVTTIGGWAFSNCNNLSSFDSPLASNDRRCLMINGELISFARNGIKDYIIQKGITSIGKTAFLGCSDLSSIIIPDSVEAIGARAFTNCKGLNVISIPESVTTIGERAFSFCEGLKSICISENVTNVGEGAFSNCKGLNEIGLSEGLSSLSKNMFQNCSNLSCFSIPMGVTVIGAGAFSGCSGLKEIIIPESVTEIGANAFSSCSGLEEVIIPEGVKIINWYAFSECTGLSCISLPSSLESIGRAFSGCTNLVSVYMYAENPPELVENSNGSWYGWGVFDGVNSDFQIYVPLKSVWNYKAAEYWAEHYKDRIHGIKRVGIDYIEFVDDNLKAKLISSFDTDGDGELSFSEAAAVTSLDGVFGTETNFISFDEFEYFTGITDIPSGLFRGWRPLYSIVLPHSVKTIDDTAFFGCEYLESITIPDGVTTIGFFAFLGCTRLRPISLPSSITSIGYCSFKDCLTLTTITLPSGITEIANGLFLQSGLERINIPKSVTTIGSDAFMNCYYLDEITIPESVKSIKSRAFMNCRQLSSITVLAKEVPQGGEEMFNFYTVSGTSVIYVPSESLDAYKTAEYWKDYADRIQSIPE